MFRTAVRQTILARGPARCESVSGRPLVIVAVDSKCACGRLYFSSLFRAGHRRPFPARTFHRLGDLRGIPHALTTASAVAAYRLSCVGNSDRIPSLALSFDFVGELARRQGWRVALPGWLPAALSGQAGLPGHFGYGSDRGRSNRLRDEAGFLGRLAWLAIRSKD